MLSLAARPYIDASVPVLREHGLTITTVFYNNMFEAHPELKNIFNMSNQANGSQQQALASAVFAYAANIDNAQALAPVIEHIVHKHVSIGVKPSHYPIVGKFLLGAIQEVLGDAATPALIAAWDEAYGLLADALITAEENLYKQTGREADSWEQMRVVKTEQQGTDVVAITLKPVNNTTVPAFNPGQYVSVAMHIDGLGLRQIRQYSLSDAPGKGTLRISVKREKGDEFRPDGKVSNKLHDEASLSAIFQVSNPYGNFTPEITANKPIALISAGVGVTPMISILNTIAEKNPSRPVLFAHAARSKQHLAHAQDVKLAETTMPDLRSVLFLNESDDDNSDAITGKMNLSDFVEDYKDADFYLCGPQGFMNDQWKALLEMGVNPNRMNREVFGPDSLNHLI